MANTVLVLVYFLIYSQILKRANLVKWLKIIIAVAFAAIAKYLFFVLTVKIIFPYLVKSTIPNNVAIILMTPQLVTALLGDVLFLILFNILNRAGLWRESS